MGDVYNYGWTGTQWVPEKTDSTGAAIASSIAQDPTSLPSAVVAGQPAGPYTSLQGETIVYLSRLMAYEDQTNGVAASAMKPIAASTYSPLRDVSSAAEASSIAKASAGNIYKFILTNGNAATRYFQFFNSTTVPADGTVPQFSVQCAAGGTVEITFPMGSYHSTGIVWCNSSTANTKTIGAADSIGLVEYF